MDGEWWKLKKKRQKMGARMDDAMLLKQRDWMGWAGSGNFQSRSPFLLRFAFVFASSWSLDVRSVPKLQQASGRCIVYAGESSVGESGRGAKTLKSTTQEMEVLR